SHSADIKYDYNNLLNIIYSSALNDSFSELIFKHTMYNTSSGQFDDDYVISDPVNFEEYEYYKMLNPIVNLAFNNSLFIAYETNFKELGGENHWKVQYQYLDLVSDDLLGPYYILSSDSQERNLDSFWSNGLFWTFTVNNSDNWDVQYTSSRRADLTSFSALSADFLPLLFNRDDFYANMSIYFTLDLGSFNNTLLESEDQLRFAVSLNTSINQYILLDTDWNVQNLESWVQTNLGSYYPDYLRYYYNLSFGPLPFSEINSTDVQVQTKRYPFELKFPTPVNFTNHFTLQFYLIKDDWSLNSTTDMDRFQLGLDNVDVSFKMIPNNYTSSTFGVLTRSDQFSSYSKSEFLITEKIGVSDLLFLTDPTLKYTESNMADLFIDFDAFSLIHDSLSEVLFAPASDLECKMMIMVQNEANPDLVISDEILYENMFTGYYLDDVKLESKWSKDFGSLYYSLNLNDYSINIYDKEDYFVLSNNEKRALFSALQVLAQSYEEIYIVFKFNVKTIDLNHYNVQNGISLIFDEFKLPIFWQNSSGLQQQDIYISRQSNDFTFFEKTSKEAYLDLLSDFDIEIDNRDDFIAFSSYSSSYYPSGTNGNYQYYLPTNEFNIEDMSPANFLNLINLHISDCVGYYDTFSGLLLDGSELSSSVGLVTPNLNSNVTCDYNLRAILYTYPFFNYQNGTDMDKAIEEFKSELLKIKLEIYNQFNIKILSEYSDTLIRFQNFDINNFSFTINSRGEKFYYMTDPLKLFIYGQDIITDTDFIFVKLVAEFLDTYYITSEKTFRNHWGLIVDDFTLEFVQGDILPEFVNIEPFEIVSDVVDITVRAVGNDYEWCALYYNYKNMGEFDGYDLISNITQSTFQDDYSYFTFTWNTTELTDDSVYKLKAILQDTKGFQGNVSISNVTVINSPPDVTCQAFSLSDQGWNLIDELEEISGDLKLSTINNDDLPLTKVTYYFHNSTPTFENRDDWVRIIELYRPDQNFDYYLHADNIPNGTWYIISEAENGGLNATFNVYVNRTLVDTFSNAINIGTTVSKQYQVSLAISGTVESHINYARFWAQKQGTTDWILLNYAPCTPFTAPLSNLPWTESTMFDVKVELEMSYSLFGIHYFNITKEDIYLDLDGPTIAVETNSCDILYQIEQAGGNWVALQGFNGIINGSITSSDPDFTSYRLSYNYGKGWRDDSKLYKKGEILNWNIKYIPDGVVAIRITGYDTYKNPSNILEFSFINDQNYFKDLYIEGWSFDHIYNIFEPFYFKIIPIAQDIQVLNLTVGNALYTFGRIDSVQGLYFENEIQFEPLDFDFEDQTVDTQILTIRASDLKFQEIVLTIPITMSLGLNTEVTIENLELEKDFYHLEGRNETTWWKFDENGGIIIYDAAGDNDGILIGYENWINGVVGDSALELNVLAYIPSQPDNFTLSEGITDWKGDLSSINGNYTSFYSYSQYQTLAPSQPDNFTLTEGTSEWNGELSSIDGNYTVFNSTTPIPDYHYPGTYSFEDVENGNDHLDWNPYGNTQVIGSLDNHQKVYELYDSSSSSDSSIYNDFSAQSCGSIEFWIRTTDAYKETRVRLRYVYDAIALRICQDKFQYFYSGLWNDITSASDNIWYHVRVDFETTMGSYCGLSQWKWHIYIDDQHYGDYSFYGNYQISKFYFCTYLDANYYSYIDAVSYSWDSNYEALGDNSYWRYYKDITSDFESEDTYISGTNIGYVDIDECTGACYATLRTFLFDDHKKFLQLYHSSSSGVAGVRNSFSSAQTSGTIEFWVRTTDATRTNYILFYQSGVQKITSRINGDLFQWHDGSIWHNLMSISDNTWYHFRIDFECGDGQYQGLSPDTATIYINDVNKGTYSFNGANNLDTVRFYLDTASVYYSLLIDGVGYSWDSSYSIGDNKDLLGPVSAEIEVTSAYSIIDGINISSRPLLYYSYLTESTQAINFSIWDFDLDNWHTISNTNFDSFTENIFILNNSFYDNNYEVLLRFYGKDATDPISFHLDMLKLFFENHSLQITSKLIVDPSNPLDLLYSFRTNISTDVKFAIYNYNTEIWEVLENQTPTSFI
ncbi:MAG: hypothetical protein ACFFDF_16375, partial [Candidatus Odinarchaeota archaeon]